MQVLLADHQIYTALGRNGKALIESPAAPTPVSPDARKIEYILESRRSTEEMRGFPNSKNTLEVVLSLRRRAATVRPSYQVQEFPGNSSSVAQNAVVFRENRLGNCSLLRSSPQESPGPFSWIRGHFQCQFTPEAALSYGLRTELVF